MYWTKTHWFRYRSSKPGIVEVKNSFSEDAEMETYSMIRGFGKHRKLPENWWLGVKTAPPGAGISEQKMKDLMDLLPFIEEQYHDFYKSLKVNKEIEEDTDPDLPSDNED